MAFSERVQGVTPQNVVLRLAGTTTDLAADVTCYGVVGALVDCSSTEVRAAVLAPAQALVPGEHYVAIVAPHGAPATITDPAGNAMPTTSGSFRARSRRRDERRARYAWEGIADPMAHGGV